MIGSANFPTGNAISCAVTVVPISAPNIMPTDCERRIIPEFIKETTVTVVTLELWTIPVTAKPTKTPLNGVFVNLFKSLLMPSPAAFCMPPDKKEIPNKNKPSPPRKLNSISRYSIAPHTKNYGNACIITTKYPDENLYMYTCAQDCCAIHTRHIYAHHPKSPHI